MARKRPTASHVAPPRLACLDGEKPDEPVLTRAESRALLRSAPLTHALLEDYFRGLPSHRCSRLDLKRPAR